MIRIGNTGQGALQLDPTRLIDSRMLIQANSGGGKSWLLRLIAERAAKHIPVIVIDYEGEFASLRETIDLVLVGSQGEIPADVRSAGLLARKLVELEVSAVLDIYELKPHERRMYVKAFLESLLALPRSLWKPILIMIDEAHKLCPQSGSQKDYASTQSVIDLMSMGGKRGFCGILATQRFSKIHNDAIAEANNVFIGRTWLSADQTRAAEYLGLTTKTEKTELRAIQQGYFYAFGPALQPSEVTLVHSDQVKTTHPRGTVRLNYTPPTASKAVQEIVSKLSDLPKRAEEEIRSFTDAKRKISELERQLRSQKAVPDDKAVAVAVSNAEREWRKVESQHVQTINELRSKLEKIAGLASLNGHAPVAVTLPPRIESKPAVVVASRPIIERQPSRETSSEVGTGGLRRILIALAQRPQGLSARQLGVRAQLSSSSGTFTTYLSTARANGWIEGGKHLMKITDAGLDALGSYEPLPSGQALLDYWLRDLGDSGASRMLSVIADAYPNGLSREEIASRSGLALSGTFTTYMSKLRTLELIEGRGEIKASDELFD